MRRRLVPKVLALAAVSVLLSAGIARADEWTAKTHVHLHVRPSATIQPNDRITFFGTLTSERPACVRHRKVVLIRRIGPQGSQNVASGRTVTDAQGRFQFPRQGLLIRTSQWRVRFKGSVEGEHPNIHTCLSSQSEWLKITVVGAPAQ